MYIDGQENTIYDQPKNACYALQPEDAYNQREPQKVPSTVTFMTAGMNLESVNCQRRAKADASQATPESLVET